MQLRPYKFVHINSCLSRDSNLGLQQPLYLNLSDDLNHSATTAGFVVEFFGHKLGKAFETGKNNLSKIISKPHFLICFFKLIYNNKIFVLMFRENTTQREVLFPSCTQEAHVRRMKNFRERFWCATDEFHLHMIGADQLLGVTPNRWPTKFFLHFSSCTWWKRYYFHHFWMFFITLRRCKRICKHAFAGQNTL